MKTNIAKRDQLEVKRAYKVLELHKLQGHSPTHLIGEAINKVEQELAAIDQALADIDNNKDESQ